MDPSIAASETGHCTPPPPRSDPDARDDDALDRTDADRALARSTAVGAASTPSGRQFLSSDSALSTVATRQTTADAEGVWLVETEFRRLALRESTFQFDHPDDAAVSTELKVPADASVVWSDSLRMISDRFLITLVVGLDPSPASEAFAPLGAALDEKSEKAVHESKLRLLSAFDVEAALANTPLPPELPSAGRIDGDPTTRTCTWLLLDVLPLLLVRSSRLLVYRLPVCERLMVRTICGRICTSLCVVELDEDENVRSRIGTRRLGL